MADNIERQLLSKLIKANNYITSKELAFSLDVSEKTILKYLNGLRSDLERNGASLEIKHGYGSMLKVDNQEKFNKYLAQNGTNRIPSTKEERKVYILSRLLNTEDYINVYDLADELYISPSLLRLIIKDLVKTIERYDLFIDHSKNHGYRIGGNEEDIRKCLSKECGGADSLVLDQSGFKAELTNQITSIVAKTLDKFNISVGIDAIDSLSLHILIAINRNETRNYIEVDENLIKKLRSSPEYYVIKNIAKQLRELYGIDLPEVEISYLTLHLNGKQRLIAHEHLQVKINNDALVFYNKFLRNIYQINSYDFFDDQELRISLLNHIVPFISRANADNQINKSSLEGIKNTFPFAYELALNGLSFLAADGIDISPAEIGYFALHLALSLEKNANDRRSYNIAVIAKEISSLYNMISFRLNRRMADASLTLKYFNINEARALRNEHSVNYDLILNTTDELFPFGNVMNISAFLSDEELEQVAERLKSSSQNDYLYNLFSRDTFIQVETPIEKNELIRQMLNECEKVYEVSDTLYQRILEREKIEATEYGNYIAIPHALRQDNGEQWIAVARLDKPILWRYQKVQLVFLINIREHHIVAWFMQKIAHLLAKENSSKELLQAETFEEFLQEFRKL